MPDWAAGTRRIGTALPEYAALDLETTGLDPARDRVIEVGAVAFTPERVSGTLERLVDPGRAVPETVLRLTGIRQEELRGAATPESALQELSEFLRGRQPGGHGARLDGAVPAAAGPRRTLWAHLPRACAAVLSGGPLVQHVLSRML